jgi:hypothetical protein
MARRPDNRPLPFRTEDDVPRARSAPPRLAHLLSGRLEEVPAVSDQERARLIREHRYPGYEPMYRLLRPRGLTVISLARAAGLNQQTVSLVMRGHREPHFFTGMRLARVLGITPDDLDRYLERVSRHPLR